MVEKNITKPRLVQINPDFYEAYRDVLTDLRIAIVNAELRYEQQQMDQLRKRRRS